MQKWRRNVNCIPSMQIKKRREARELRACQRTGRHAGRRVDGLASGNHRSGDLKDRGHGGRDEDGGDEDEGGHQERRGAGGGHVRLQRLDLELMYRRPGE